MVSGPMHVSQYQLAEQARRAAILLVVGGGLSAVGLVVGRASDGFLGAAAFLLALMAAAIAFGVFAEMAGGLIVASSLRRNERRCGACAGRKERIVSIWVCRFCDQIEG